jgi:hypothetical protein
MVVGAAVRLTAQTIGLLVPWLLMLVKKPGS